MDKETQDLIAELRAKLDAQAQQIAALSTAVDKVNSDHAAHERGINALADAQANTNKTVGDLANNISGVLETVANLTGHPTIANLIDAVRDISGTYFRETFVRYFATPDANEAKADAGTDG